MQRTVSRISGTPRLNLEMQGCSQHPIRIQPYVPSRPRLCVLLNTCDLAKSPPERSKQNTVACRELQSLHAGSSTMQSEHKSHNSNCREADTNRET